MFGTNLLPPVKHRTASDGMGEVTRAALRRAGAKGVQLIDPKHLDRSRYEREDMIEDPDCRAARRRRRQMMRQIEGRAGPLAGTMPAQRAADEMADAIAKSVAAGHIVTIPTSDVGYLQRVARGEFSIKYGPKGGRTVEGGAKTFERMEAAGYVTCADRTGNAARHGEQPIELTDAGRAALR